jgi:hypothetical protein
LEDWPFDQARNVAAVSDASVVDDRAPVLLVVHYSEDDSWGRRPRVVAAGEVSLPRVVKYHGLARRYLMPSGFLMRPLLDGGTLARRNVLSEMCIANPRAPSEQSLRADACGSLRSPTRWTR